MGTKQNNIWRPSSVDRATAYISPDSSMDRTEDF